MKYLATLFTISNSFSLANIYLAKNKNVLPENLSL